MLYRLTKHRAFILKSIEFKIIQKLDLRFFNAEFCL